MPNFQTKLTNEGIILWHRPDLTKDLRKVARYSIFEGTYVTVPTAVEIAREALAFAHQHNIAIEAPENLRSYLQDPEELVKYHQVKMAVLSHTISSFVKLTHPLRTGISPFVLAGIKYVMISQRCIIADPSADDRIAVALGSLNQIKGFRCVLVCSKENREYWLKQINARIPGDVQILEITQLNGALPERSIVFVDIAYLETMRPINVVKAEGIPTTCLVVDDAHCFKNRDANRTQMLLRLSTQFPYRFLLTNYPMSLSYRDLSVLIQILGRQLEFQDLYDLINDASSDPIENRYKYWFLYWKDFILDQLYLRLRTICMVRRGDDRELRFPSHVENITLSDGYPIGIDPDNVQHPLHDIGVRKIRGSIGWLQRFLQGQSEKILILAHHNIVVEQIGKALGVPTYYGPVTSKKERSVIRDGLRNEGNLDTLIVADEVEFDWDLTKVSKVVFVEMPRSLRQYASLMNALIKGNKEKSISIYFLLSDERMDINGYDRLQYRRHEYDVVIDGNNRLR